MVFGMYPNGMYPNVMTFSDKSNGTKFVCEMDGIIAAYNCKLH